MQVERASLSGEVSGERVSNTWATYPGLRDNFGKPGLIPDRILACMGWDGKVFLVWDGPAAYQLVGGEPA
jgi:hypothetical protein